MRIRSGLSALLLAGVCTAGLTGCQLMHELNPHRWKRMNYGVDGMPSDDYHTFNRSNSDGTNPYFASVVDPVCLPADDPLD